ncbi:MAG: cell division protein CrgA [Propionicimonas sp.]|nr:cell division protein CrgA [Propionicimonas sp.]
MPESRVRKTAAEKKKQASKEKVSQARAEEKRHVVAPGSRQWVAPAFITLGLIGVIWLVVYYITASTGIQVPVMTDLGAWNVGIGMTFMAGAFALSTLWK